jgi:hypothetical protein
MNCLECRELIQRMMDGDFSPENQSALAAHATSCHNCRELQAAARRLLDGLRRAARPEPPAGLDQRICQAALLQSQRQFRTRRVAWAAAMAAGILAVLSLGYFWQFSLGKPQPSALAIRPAPADLSKPAPSLNHMKRLTRPGCYCRRSCRRCRRQASRKLSRCSSSRRSLCRRSREA